MGELIDLNPKKQLISSSLQTQVTFVGPLNFPANTWTSLPAIPGFSLGVFGFPSALLISLHFRYSEFPWHQICCSGVCSFVWWKPEFLDFGHKFLAEAHNSASFFVSIRGGLGDGPNRRIEINPESAISIPAEGLVDVSVNIF